LACQYRFTDTRDATKGAFLNPQDLKSQYQDNMSRAQRLREAVVVQLEELLSSNDVVLGVPMESRVKSWMSLEDKLTRKGIQLNNILELQDLVGIRAILLFRADIDRVEVLIRKTFDVISSEDASSRLGESEFGYQSRHFAVRIPKEWLKLPSLAGLADFFVEIQVRTVAQHIWAAASHKLQYKQEAAVPPPVRRSINRVSALLETVDLELDRVLDERHRYLEAVRESSTNDNEPLNVDNLAAILSELLPSENLNENEPYAALLANLHTLGVTSGRQLREILGRQSGAMRAADAERVAEEKSRSTTNKTEDSERVARGVFYTHVGLAREALRKEFGEKKVALVIAETNTERKLIRELHNRPAHKRKSRNQK